LDGPQTKDREHAAEAMYEEELHGFWHDQGYLGADGDGGDEAHPVIKEDSQEHRADSEGDEVVEGDILEGEERLYGGDAHGEHGGEKVDTEDEREGAVVIFGQALGDVEVPEGEEGDEGDEEEGAGKAEESAMEGVAFLVGEGEALEGLRFFWGDEFALADDELAFLDDVGVGVGFFGEGFEVSLGQGGVVLAVWGKGTFDEGPEGLSLGKFAQEPLA